MMTQNIHRLFSRPVNSSRFDQAEAMLCGNYLKGIKWYEAPGAEEEVGYRRK